MQLSYLNLRVSYTFQSNDAWYDQFYPTYSEMISSEDPLILGKEDDKLQDYLRKMFKLPAVFTVTHFHITCNQPVLARVKQWLKHEKPDASLEDIFWEVVKQEKLQEIAKEEAQDSKERQVQGWTVVSDYENPLKSEYRMFSSKEDAVAFAQRHIAEISQDLNLLRDAEFLGTVADSLRKYGQFIMPGKGSYLSRMTGVDAEFSDAKRVIVKIAEVYSQDFNSSLKCLSVYKTPDWDQIRDLRDDEGPFLTEACLLDTETST